MHTAKTKQAQSAEVDQGLITKRQILFVLVDSL
jgi:hypothetical protein